MREGAVRREGTTEPGAENEAYGAACPGVGSAAGQRFEQTTEHEGTRDVDDERRPRNVTVGVGQRLGDAEAGRRAERPTERHESHRAWMAVGGAGVVGHRGSA